MHGRIPLTTPPVTTTAPDSPPPLHWHLPTIPLLLPLLHFLLAHTHIHAHTYVCLGLHLPSADPWSFIGQSLGSESGCECRWASANRILKGGQESLQGPEPHTWNTAGVGGCEEGGDCSVRHLCHALKSTPGGSPAKASFPHHLLPLCGRKTRSSTGTGGWGGGQWPVVFVIVIESAASASCRRTFNFFVFGSFAGV